MLKLPNWAGGVQRVDRRLAVLTLVFAAGCLNLAAESSRNRLSWSVWPESAGQAAAAAPRREVGRPEPPGVKGEAKEGRQRVVQGGASGEGGRGGADRAEGAGRPVEGPAGPEKVSAAAGSRHPAAGPRPGAVDLNRAGCPELESLPGIGPVLARRIVGYREKNGPFQSTEELVEVPGIGPAKLRRLSGLISAGEGALAGR